MSLNLRDLSPNNSNSRTSVTIVTHNNDRNDDESFDISFHTTPDDETKSPPSQDYTNDTSNNVIFDRNGPGMRMIKTHRALPQSSHRSPSSPSSPSSPTSSKRSTTAATTDLVQTKSTLSSITQTPSKPRRRSSASTSTPIKPTLPAPTLNMFTKLLPNQQISQRHLEQLSHPISLPSSLPLSSLTPATQQLANFLIDHLQTQQGHLATLQKDVYGMRDVVWAGGLVLQKHQKHLHSLEGNVTQLEGNVTQLEGNVSQLRSDLLQQEARLRAEIIYQQQRQVLERIRFASEQRQTRIDNLLDTTLILIAILLTALPPISALNSTLSSITVSLIHILIKNVGDRNPYTWERLSPPQDLTLPQPKKSQNDRQNGPQSNTSSPTTPNLNTLSPSQSPISQLAHFGGPGQGQESLQPPPQPQHQPQWTQWSNPGLQSTSPTLIATPPASIVLTEPQRLRKRRFRTAAMRGTMRMVEVGYVFLFLRKLLVNYGMIQSPLSVYVKLVVPLGMYNALSGFSLNKLKRQIVAPFDWIMSIGEKTPYKTFPDEDTNVESDVVVMSEPMSKEEIYQRVLANLKSNPHLAQSILENGYIPPQHVGNGGIVGGDADGNGLGDGEGGCYKENDTLSTAAEKLSPSSSTLRQTVVSSTLKSFLPTWASDYVVPFADRVVGAAMDPLSLSSSPLSHQSVGTSSQIGSIPGRGSVGGKGDVDGTPPYQQRDHNQHGVDSTHQQHQSNHHTPPNPYSHLDNTPYNPYGYDYTTQQLLRSPVQIDVESDGEEGQKNGGKSSGQNDVSLNQNGGSSAPFNPYELVASGGSNEGGNVDDEGKEQGQQSSTTEKKTIKKETPTPEEAPRQGTAMSVFWGTLELIDLIFF